MHFFSLKNARIAWNCVDACCFRGNWHQIRYWLEDRSSGVSKRLPGDAPKGWVRNTKPRPEATQVARISKVARAIARSPASCRYRRFQTRGYRWRNPPQIGWASTYPTLLASRGIGAFFVNDRCVLTKDKDFGVQCGRDRSNSAKAHHISHCDRAFGRLSPDSPGGETHEGFDIGSKSLDRWDPRQFRRSPSRGRRSARLPRVVNRQIMAAVPPRHRQIPSARRPLSRLLRDTSKIFDL